jgi:hypothetical protein
MGDKSEGVAIGQHTLSRQKNTQNPSQKLRSIDISSDMSMVERHVLNPKKKENKKN